MARAFLSHSSLDKGFVVEVYRSLGAARAVYDAVTFRRNCDLVEQIEKGVEGADIYVLFLSRAALESGWVKAEMDLAHEMRMRFNVRSVLIFQLEDIAWSALPSWMSRYVVSCPPSPDQAALRILDEINPQRHVLQRCVGRDEEIRSMATEIIESEAPPRFLYLSGPDGIGRRSLASAVFSQVYPEVAFHKIRVAVDQYDDVPAIHRKLIKFSSSWRARELVEETNRFSALDPNEQLVDLARLIEKIAVAFRQIVIFDVGSTVLDDDGRPLPWFSSLLGILPQADYPYVWIISKRFLSPSGFGGGVFLAVQPLDEKNSRYLFKLLINEHKLVFPSAEEKESIEKSVIGHPGLISKVVSHLRVNPTYKPNKTHNGIIKLIAEQVELILNDIVSRNPEHAKVAALFAESGVLSFQDIHAVAADWLGFDSAVSALIDAGMIISDSGEYYLAPYIQRAAQSLPANNADEIKRARSALFARVESIGAEDFVPLAILDDRVVELISTGADVSGYLKNLVMPSQQLKAARRCYDREQYTQALRLAKDCFEQSFKLSERGKLEAWRLIGLSAIRIPDDAAFSYFETSVKELPSSKAREAIFNFALGFRARFAGDLRAAQASFMKIEGAGSADSHVYRELAYIYTFEGAYDEALAAVSEGLKLAPENAYMLDMKAFALLEKYKRSKDRRILDEIDVCLESLRQADSRVGTKFSSVRTSTRDVVAGNHSGSLHAAFKGREQLPIMARVSLLSLLSYRDERSQYASLLSELSKARRTNKLADIEISRIEIERLALDGEISAARDLLGRFRNRFPPRCVDALREHIDRSEGFHKGATR